MGCIPQNQYNPFLHEIISVHNTEGECNEECGVCCINSICVDNNQTQCAAAGGIWYSGVSCEDVICPSPSPSISPSPSLSVTPSISITPSPFPSPSPSGGVCCVPGCESDFSAINNCTGNVYPYPDYTCYGCEYYSNPDPEGAPYTNTNFYKICDNSISDYTGPEYTQIIDVAYGYCPSNHTEGCFANEFDCSSERQSGFVTTINFDAGSTDPTVFINGGNPASASTGDPCGGSYPCTKKSYEYTGSMMLVQKNPSYSYGYTSCDAAFAKPNNYIYNGYWDDSNLYMLFTDNLSTGCNGSTDSYLQYSGGAYENYLPDCCSGISNPTGSMKDIVTIIRVNNYATKHITYDFDSELACNPEVNYISCNNVTVSDPFNTTSCCWRFNDWAQGSNAHIGNISGYFMGRKSYYITHGGDPGASAYSWNSGYPGSLPQYTWVLEHFFGYAQYSVNSCYPNDPGRNGSAFGGTVNACGPSTYGVHSIVKYKWRLYTCDTDGSVIDITDQAVTPNGGTYNANPFAGTYSNISASVDNLLDFHVTLSEGYTSPTSSTTHSGAFDDTPVFDTLNNLPSGSWTVCYSPTGAYDQGRNFSPTGNPNCITYSYSNQYPSWIYTHQEYSPPCGMVINQSPVYTSNIGLVQSRGHDVHIYMCDTESQTMTDVSNYICDKPIPFFYPSDLDSIDWAGTYGYYGLAYPFLYWGWSGIPVDNISDYWTGYYSPSYLHPTITPCLTDGFIRNGLDPLNFSPPCDPPNAIAGNFKESNSTLYMNFDPVNNTLNYSFDSPIGDLTEPTLPPFQTLPGVAGGVNITYACVDSLNINTCAEIGSWHPGANCTTLDCNA
jgi:hypothetical protein